MVSRQRCKMGQIAWVALVAGLLIVLAGCKQPAETVPPVQPYAGPTSTPRPGETLPAPQGSTPQSPPQADGNAVAAMVNGEPLALADYQKQVGEWETAFVAQNVNLSEQEKEEMLIQGRRQVLDVMIEQLLIEQAAARAGVVVSDAEVESVIARDIEENGGQAQFEAWLQANDWTYEEYKSRQRSMMIASQMFEQVTKDVPTEAEQVRARHILVTTEQEAQDLLAELQGGADFRTLAREHSLDPSTRESGGDLGFFPRGTLVVPEVEEAAFSLSVGEISDVVSSAMGYHIVQVVERSEQMALTEESWQALREVTFRGWVSSLWASAQIEILIAV
jgi:peptidyl-prolyl cis-trans isomerase C